MSRLFWISLSLSLVSVAACGDDGGNPDASPPTDAAVSDAAIAVDAAALPDGDGEVDGGEVDGAVPDAAVADGAVPPPPDAAVPPPPPDAGVSGELHMHIYIDNFCNTSVVPAEVSVAAGDTVQLTWHNHSVDYDADVWLSYGGGYLGLVPGDTWADQFDFCAGPGPYEAASDVSIAGGPSQGCPGFTVQIHCL